MKISPLVLLLGGALVGALAWGTCSSGRASDAEIRLAALQHQDSLEGAAWATQRDSLTTQLRGLRADSATLAIRYTSARRAAVASRDSLGKLLAALPDSTRLQVEQAVTVLRQEVEACEAVVENCEARAVNAEARTHGDSLRLVQLQAFTDTVEAAWHRAEQRAKPSFFRDLWRSRSVTLPLMALSAILLLRK